MRTALMVISTSVLLILVSACDNGDEGKDVPRTVSPAQPKLRTNSGAVSGRLIQRAS